MLSRLFALSLHFIFLVFVSTRSDANGQMILEFFSLAMIFGVVIRQGRDLSLMAYLAQTQERSVHSAEQVFKSVLRIEWIRFTIAIWVAIAALFYMASNFLELSAGVLFLCVTSVCGFYAEIFRGVSKTKWASVVGFLVPAIALWLVFGLGKLIGDIFWYLPWIYFGLSILLVALSCWRFLAVSAPKNAEDNVADTIKSSADSYSIANVHNTLLLWGAPLLISKLGEVEMSVSALNVRVGLLVLIIAQLSSYNYVQKVAGFVEGSEYRFNVIETLKSSALRVLLMLGLAGMCAICGVILFLYTVSKYNLSLTANAIFTPKIFFPFFLACFIGGLFYPVMHSIINTRTRLYVANTFGVSWGFGILSGISTQMFLKDVTLSTAVVFSVALATPYLLAVASVLFKNDF